jgi:hypothetical protein
MPEPVTVVDRDGNAIAVPEGDAGYYLHHGYHADTSEEMAGRTEAAARENTYGGIKGKIAAGVQGAVRGATAGGSDALAGLDEDAARGMAGFKEYNPGTALISELAGAAIANPFGKVGSAVSKLGEGAGFAGRTAAHIGAGAAEGAGYGAGGYVSDVALGNKPLSAEGFMASMGQGALWGGVASGALSVSGDALANARKLFPAEQMTPQAVEAAVGEAKQAMRGAVDRAEAMDSTTSRLVRASRQEAAAADPAFAAQVEARGHRAAQELAESRVPQGLEEGSLAEGSGPAGTGRPAPKDTSNIAGLREQMGLPTSDLDTWRAKYPGGMVDLGEMAPGARKGALKSWAEGFEPASDVGATVKDYTLHGSGAVDPVERAGMPFMPPEIAKVARTEGAAAARTGYNETLAAATNQAQSGAELLARATYGGKRAAAQMQDLVAATHAQGLPLTEDVLSALRKKVRATHIEDQMNAELGKVNPHVRDMLDRQSELREANDAMKGLLGGDKEAAAAGEAIEGHDVDLSDLVGKEHGFDLDLDKAADAISRHEAASAEIADALGAHAPIESQAHAQAFRTAQEAAEHKSSQAIADHTAKVDDAAHESLTKEVQPAKKGKSALKSVADKASKGLAIADVAHMIGMGPALHAIPVVGPLLHVVAKAKILQAAYKRLLKGEIAETAETTIASKASDTINRVSKALDGVFQGAKVAAGKAPAPAAILGHTLFDGGPPQKSRPIPVKGGDEYKLFQQRADELVASQQPGAIEKAIKARISTQDPEIIAETVAAYQRQLGFLYSKLPKPAMGDNPLKDGAEIPVARQQIAEFAKYVRVAQDPAHVFEKVYRGELITPVDLETLHTVYPSLVGEGSAMMAKKAMTGKGKLSYSSRVQLSILSGGAFDHSMLPEMNNYLQGGYQAPPPASPSGNAGKLGPPMKGTPSFKEQTLTSLDQR